jgi:hypothetical protein
LPKKIEEILNTKPADLRDNHLVRIDTNILDRITIDAPGKTKTVLARKDGNWTIANRNNAPADAGAVRRMIDALQNERVTKFVEDVASNLPKYGLDKPQLQLTFSSFASENTAESKAGEQPFATIAFGKDEGDNVYARLTTNHLSWQCVAGCSIRFHLILCDGRICRSSNLSRSRFIG